MPRKGTEIQAVYHSHTRSTIWKWDAPEGDGNNTLSPNVRLWNIWKWDAPEGDGNYPVASDARFVTDLEMRCPGRGRKSESLCYSQPHSIWKWDAPDGDGNSSELVVCEFGYDLEMRCPGRGRKCHSPLWFASHFIIWKWDAPEGDGNSRTSRIWRKHDLQFGNEMPRKGTETINPKLLDMVRRKKFGNEMPRKGTETQCHRFPIPHT